MDTSYYELEEKSQRRRVIAIATVITIVVLGIAAWAIVSIISNDSENLAADTKTEVAVDDRLLDPEAPAIEGVASEAAEPATESIENSTVEANLATVTSVPEAGPADLLPLALVVGSGAAFLASRKLAKDEIAA